MAEAGQRIDEGQTVLNAMRQSARDRKIRTSQDVSCLEHSIAKLTQRTRYCSNNETKNMYMSDCLITAACIE